MSSLRESNIVRTIFKMPIWLFKNLRPFYINNAFKGRKLRPPIWSNIWGVVTMLFCSKHTLISFIFDNSCHIATAFRARTTQHQHAGLDLAGQVADGRPCSVKAYGRYFECWPFLKIPNRNLKDLYSSGVSWNIKSFGKRSMLRFTALFRLP